MDAFFNEFKQPVGAPLPDWRGARPPQRATLCGRYVRLEPLDAAKHAESLYAAYSTPTDEPIWTYIGVGPFDSDAAFTEYLHKAQASPDPMHFALIDLATERAIGTFALMRIDAPAGVIEIGFVVYSPLLRRTRIATEAMFLMMRHVFDELGYRRFEWKCDALNAPSRAAALRYGFQYEGLFRQATIYKGRNRDTAWFSVLDSEWPHRRDAYEQWLDPRNFTEAGAQLKRLDTQSV